MDKSTKLNEKILVEIEDKYEKLYHTYQYENFTFINGNRDINNANMLQIMGSIITKGLIKNPILVKIMDDGKLGIVDGQHVRFVGSR